MIHDLIPFSIRDKIPLGYTAMYLYKLLLVCVIVSVMVESGLMDSDGVTNPGEIYDYHNYVK